MSLELLCPIQVTSTFLPHCAFPVFFFFFHLFLINFIFGCVGSSLLFKGFSQVVAGAAL